MLKYTLPLPTKTLDNYFLGSHKVPWFAIMFSIVVAETSTLTLVSIPGLAYDTNLQFLQLVFGYIIARIIISVIFIPAYFQGKIYTAYEFIKNRFGDRLYFFTATLFLVTRALAEGVRVFAIAIVLSVVFGINEIPALALVILVTCLYSYHKGLPIVIWSDFLQVCIYLLGAIFTIYILQQLIPGGWHTIYQTAQAQHKLQIFNFTFHFFLNYTFWSGLIGGTFLTLASHGTDQLIVQRILAAKNQQAAKAAMIMSGFIILIQFTLFLIIGLMLWVFYQKFPSAIIFNRSDKIFPAFIHQYMTKSAAIFLMTAILAAAMGNLSAALNSLSSSLVMDFYLRIRPRITEQQKMLAARFGILFWALIIFTLAIAASHGGRVLEMGLTIISVTYGCVLGVFVLGIFSKQVKEFSAFIGMVCGLMVNLYLWKFTQIAFTWYVFIGSISTIFVGYVTHWLTSQIKNSLITDKIK